LVLSGVASTLSLEQSAVNISDACIEHGEPVGDRRVWRRH
jgi:hypothetical protein